MPLHGMRVQKDAMFIGRGDIHLWVSSFKILEETCDSLEFICSNDELTRADKFRFAFDRHRFLLSRAFLRCTLAPYIGTSGANIRFQYGGFGKPSAESSGGLEFSFSRSGDYAAVAVARAPVGLDLEQVRGGIRVDEVAASFFSVTEQRSLAAVPPPRGLAAFYRCWVSKEAYVKACGLGLSLPLDQFDVAVDPDGPAALLRPPEVPGGDGFSLHAVDAIPGYAMALAARTPPRRLTIFRGQDDAENGAANEGVPTAMLAARGAEMLGRTHISPIGVQP